MCRVRLAMASQKVHNGRMEDLWKQYFRDPVLWHDNRSTKCSAVSPDFRHKISSSQSLWIDGLFNPSWVSEELIRRAEMETHRDLKTRYEKEEEEIWYENPKEGFDSTYVSLLMSCTKKKDLCKGAKLHAHILKMGLLDKRSSHLGSALINMYAKCGNLQEARQVLEELSFRCVVSWNSLISGYCQHRQSREAIDCFEQMQNEGISPDVVTFTCILKACGKAKNVQMGKQIHEEIIDRGLLEKDVVLGTALVDMYIKCDELKKAKEVLIELPVRDVVTWNALIAGYAQEGQGHEALICFEWMQSEGFSSDLVTFLSVLKACGVSRDVDKGKLFHDEIVAKGLLEKDIAIGNAVIDMYAKCGALTKAHQVLEDLPFRNAISWNSLVAGYALEGQDHNALNCFEQMQSEGISPDPVTFICILSACAKTRAIDKGKQIHEEIVSRGLLEKNSVLGNALVDMYAKCGVLVKAQAVLEKLPDRDVVTWSAIIAGYAEQGQGQEALKCFERMQNEGLSPNVVTLISILKACGNTGAVNKGKQIHDEIMSRGLLPNNVLLGTALVDMYAKCGILAKAQQVLEELPVKDIVSWSALLAGYGQQGQVNEALECFEHMQSQGLSPDEVTFVCILKACGSACSLDKGKQVHDEIVSKGFLEKNVILGNALVDMYCKCGALAKAQEVFKELPSRDIISWNALIAGYAQQGQYHKALNLFERMRKEGFCPDAVSFICILQACGSIGAIDKGKKIHDEIVDRGLLEKDTVLGNALVDMYAKCGLLTKAQGVLWELPVRDIVSWNALISGYAEQKQGNEALRCFKHLQSEGLSPNEVTLLCVLKACCHSALLNETHSIFRDMVSKYGITPNIEHHTCMIMAFGSAGLFEKALSVIKAMPSSDDPVVWLTLLGACRKWGNVELGKLAFDQAMQLDSSCAAAYVVLVDLFTLAGMQEDAEKAEAMRLKYAKQKSKNAWV